MKLTGVTNKVYSSLKIGVKKAFEPQKPKVTGLLPDAWRKSPHTGLSEAQLIDLILRGLY